MRLRRTVARHRPELLRHTLLDPPLSRSDYIPLDLRSNQIFKVAPCTERLWVSNELAARSTK